MGNEKLIRDLRGILTSATLTQGQFETICRAIKALGGKP